MKVHEFMHHSVIFIHENATLLDAARIFKSQGISSLPVVGDNEQLTGIITISDFIGVEIDVPHALVTVKEIFNEWFYFRNIEEIYKKSAHLRVSEIMTRNPKTMRPSDELNNVVRFMMEKSLKRVPIQENGKLVGMVTRTNLVHAFLKLNEDKPVNPEAPIGLREKKR